MSPSSQKTSFSLLPWLVMSLFLGLICIIFAGAPGVLTFLMDNHPFGNFTSTQAPQTIGHPTMTSIATIAPFPTITTEASEKFGTFSDDFSDPNSGWGIDSNQSYATEYTQQQNYAITILVPNRYVFVTPPPTLTLPFKNATVKVEIKQGNYPGSSYGVMCGFQNNSSFYAVQFKGREYSVVKMVQGLSTTITSPEWKKASNIEYVDGRGYVHLTVNCNESSIGIQINGQSQPVVVDPDNTFQSGDVAIFAVSSSAAKGKYYNQVLLDNFSLTVNK
jgi:hypothetical protein